MALWLKHASHTPKMTLLSTSIAFHIKKKKKTLKTHSPFKLSSTILSTGHSPMGINGLNTLFRMAKSCLVAITKNPWTPNAHESETVSKCDFSVCVWKLLDDDAKKD